MRQQRSIVATLVVAGCTAHLPIVEQLRDDRMAGPSDVVYTLPRKLVRVELTTVRTSYTVEPPPCAEYVGWVDAKSRRAETLSLNRPADLATKTVVTSAAWSTVVIPDPEARFVVRLDNRRGATRDALSLSWAPGAILTDSASESVDTSADLAVKVLGAITSIADDIAGSANFAAYGGASHPSRDERREICLDLAARRSMLIDQLDALRATPGNGAFEAEFASKETRLKNDVDRIEAAFTGRKEEVAKVVCEVDPIDGRGIDGTLAGAGEWSSLGGDARVALLAFDPARGFSDLTANHCEIPKSLRAPVTIDMKSPTARWYELRIDAVAHTPPAVEPRSPVAGEERSYHYRRSAPAALWVGEIRRGHGDKYELARESESRVEWIPQLGTLAFLPMIRGATVKGKITLDPETGDLKALELMRSWPSVDPWTERLGELIATVAEAARPKSDQENLDATKAELEARVAIEEARRKLAEWGL